VNDHGVFRSDGSCIPCKTEKDVFDCLHIKYIDPTLRESETALEILEDQVSRSYFSLIVLALSVMSPSAAVPFVSLYVFKYVFVEGTQTVDEPETSPQLEGEGVDEEEPLKHLIWLNRVKLKELRLGLCCLLDAYHVSSFRQLGGDGDFKEQGQQQQQQQHHLLSQPHYS
ncbi:hypothetical protein FOZ63_014943, partial [Perkinsus olseni]